RYEGLCPFHDERTPSFGIDPVQKVYHCFGCQASGDLFTFVQETEGVDFKGALELLAGRYGVELVPEKEDPGEAERRRARERLLGFGARAMREEQRPKYLNTSDNAIYHKGSHLFGASLARPHATRAGEVIVCEGYTDTIALHQAGMRNAVGLMGTALTSEQVAELARMAKTVLLALDADSAGHEAMLRASALAAKRKLELRVVALPAGEDPAD